MKQKLTISGRTAFYIFICVVVIVLITVWLTGLEIHRTVIRNSFYSLSILTSFFFVAITWGLYSGAGMREDFGRIKEPKSGFSSAGVDLPFPDVADGIEGIILSILLWIGLLVLYIILSMFFEAILYFTVAIAMSALYWVFYRACILILRYSRFTKGDLWRSVWIAFKYSAMYSVWMFAIVWIADLMK